MAAIESSNDSVSAEGTRVISGIDDAHDAGHEEQEAVGADNEDLQIEDLGTPSPLQGDAPVEPAPTITTSPSKKGTMSATTAHKANGGPPTPTVKKIINSGTFGTGSVKPTVPKATSATSAAPAKTAAPPLKKANYLCSSPSLQTNFGVIHVLQANCCPSGRSCQPQSVRRAHEGISSSYWRKTFLIRVCKCKASSDPASTRKSVVSPSGSVASAKATSATSAARPRASVSEAAKKAPLASRPSLAGTAKPSAGPIRATTVSRSAAAPAPKSRTTASISSIKEVKEDSAKDDGKVAKLQNQLEEATKTLESKTVAVVDLEAQVKTLQDSLSSALVEAESKGASATTELETAKAAAEAQLSEVQATLSTTQEQLAIVTTALGTLEQELASAKAAAAQQTDLVHSLQTQIHGLEADLQSSKEKLEVLERSSAADAASAAQASSADRDALLTAKADLATASGEVSSLKAAHEAAVKESEARIAELQEKTAATETLEAQIVALKSEKEESVNKLSELEVEILELKETQEGLEDAQGGLKKRVAALENDLAKAASDASAAAEAASKREAEHAHELVELVAQHQKELEAASLQQEELTNSLEGLRTQHTEALAAHERTKQDGLKREEERTSQLQELETEHLAKQAAISAKLEKVSQELQDQESIYNSKVDSVKAEHAQLLQEAFERAKKEAAEAHTQELQALRSGSNNTMEQIQAASQIAIAELKAEHALQLESELGGLNKQISKLNIELKATQDDLTKSKAALESSRADVESLTKQRDDARAQAEAVPTLSPEHAEEIARLAKELSNTKDDFAATKDMLELTKSSMHELSEKHSKELEEAAKARADEILKVRSAHDAEINKLATQKSELLVSLSDLQGELATAKAALAAQATASPKSNGSSHPPTSPGVTKEELTKLHEAHNLKIHDLQAEHEKAMRLAREDLDKALDKIGELNQDLSRKAMEIQYLEQDQEENQEQITRLKEDIDALTAKSGNST
ncbi:hypothetical protein NLJ89_g1112 [Agrocybe chaxingu]|uniref:Uncharacterized protein n=1 Tax=Agrocybe chaxingu TaxID=84603 RepID=A0A9W8N0R7_9AGAR|nr:hypothetical protein NLJ89_g1112 [Agrocybe chaxingu]